MARPKDLPLNIQPDGGGDGSKGLMDILKSIAFYTVLQGPLLIPCVIGFQKYLCSFYSSKEIETKKISELKKQHKHNLKATKQNYEKLIKELKKEHEEEISILKAKHTKTLEFLEQVKNGCRENFHSRLSKLLDEETLKEQTLLSSLKEVEPGIQRILDVRCSILNPNKPKHQRQSMEDELIQTSPVEFREGLQNIFAHDYKHCGGGIYANGQLWRVWMQLWKAQAKAQKYENIVEQLRMEKPK